MGCLEFLAAVLMVVAIDAPPPTKPLPYPFPPDVMLSLVNYPDHSAYPSCW